MRTHMYIEGNPLRARMVKNLKFYRFCSFKFYAWGIKDEFSDRLTIPEWYMELGDTPEKRQRRYRSFFERYMKEVICPIPEMSRSYYIGDTLWVVTQVETMRKTRSRRQGQSPPTQPMSEFAVAL